MCSYEDRIRAVKLYLKLGKRTGATILQLEYPTKNALKSWHREDEQCDDLPMGYVRLKLKCLDKQKKVAARHYLNHDRCLAGTLKALGCCHALENKTIHKILKSAFHAEDLRLRTAQRLTNLTALFCILSWRIFWLTMLNRAAPAAPATLAFTPVEVDLLNKLAPTGEHQDRNRPTPSSGAVWRV